MSLYNNILSARNQGKKLLAILIDPDKFEVHPVLAKAYLKKLPVATTHLFIGGSTDINQKTAAVVKLLNTITNLPIILFPGDYKQITPEADAILFLSLLSGDNPEFLIGQQTKAAFAIQKSKLEVIPTGYLLIDGGIKTAVERVSKTTPMPQDNIKRIVATALAGQYLGKKMIYLEAGSGAQKVVHPSIISAVCEVVEIPVIVGGGVRASKQLHTAYDAGATLVVVGTAFENDSWKRPKIED